MLRGRGWGRGGSGSRAVFSSCYKGGIMRAWRVFTSERIGERRQERGTQEGSKDTHTSWKMADTRRGRPRPCRIEDGHVQHDCMIDLYTSPLQIDISLNH